MTNWTVLGAHRTIPRPVPVHRLAGHRKAEIPKTGSKSTLKAVAIIQPGRRGLDVGGGIRLNFCLLCIVIAVTAHVKVLIFVSYSIAGGHLV